MLLLQDRMPNMLTNIDTGFFPVVINAFPAPIFIVDEDVRISAINEGAAGLLDNPATAIEMRGGEALHCVHATDVPEGCGRSPACKSCVIRNSVTKSFGDHKVSRCPAKMRLKRSDGVEDAHMLVTASPLEYKGRRYSLLVLEDINELVDLRQLLPICCNCKKIRIEREYWQEVESYFSDHLDIDFSHGICPDCVRKLYPDVKLPNS
jgi:hypothetical protein